MDAQKEVQLVRANDSACDPRMLDANGCDEVFEFPELPQFTTKVAPTHNACFKSANHFA
jgi:hypothetical protein